MRMTTLWILRFLVLVTVPAPSTEASMLGDTVTIRGFFTSTIITQTDTRVVTVGADGAVVQTWGTGVPQVRVNVDPTEVTMTFLGNFTMDTPMGIEIKDIDQRVLGATIVSAPPGFDANRLTLGPNSVFVRLGGSWSIGTTIVVGVQTSGEDDILALLNERLDATVSSRADQATATAIKTKVPPT